GTFPLGLTATNSVSTANQTLTVRVWAPPVAVADAFQAGLNTARVVAAPGVLSNDTVNGATIVSYGSPNGTEQTTIGSATPTAQGGTITLNADGSFTYTPAAAFTGADTFKYVLSNFAGSSTATVSFTVFAAPTAVADAYSSVINTPLSVAAGSGVLANDTVNGATIASYGTPNGTEQTTIGSSTATSAGGTITVNANGSFTYTPASNFTGTDTFKYILQNPAGNSTATVTFNVVAAPITVDDAFQAAQNTARNVSAPGVLANDTVNSGSISS